ncbi:MAG: T9SS type A sorting domain-containing protein [Bacteroidetes bacterium]|nr:T9SS type A sorting domain-containing protein [Bacteroidota bacterium]MBL7102979.1 T9SS type A sorting domain-containing protein [Bacteroidales bacterium]
MKAKKLFLAALLTIAFGNATLYSQPQWKFHIAFEDGTGAKDTMWFIWDETATIFGIDTALGEGQAIINQDEFNVFTLLGVYPNLDTSKVFAIPYNEYFEKQLFAINYALPLKLSWDSSLFHADFLPPEPVGWVNYARLYSDYFFWINNNPNNQDFDMTLIDTVMSPDPSITDPWFWQPWIHFPINVYMHQEPQTNVKLEVSNSLLFNIYPNPSNNFLKIESNNEIRQIRILNISGETLYKANILENSYSIDISFLKNGIYILKLIYSKNQYYYEKFIKSD